jgi:hypothetical protein
MQKEKASFQVIPNCPEQTGINLRNCIAPDQKRGLFRRVGRIAMAMRRSSPRNLVTRRRMAANCAVQKERRANPYFVAKYGHGRSLIIQAKYGTFAATEWMICCPFICCSSAR